MPQARFQLSVLSDEISQDFARACEVASQEFSLRQIELRSLWSKNALGLDSNEIAEALRLLKRFDLQVTAIASPLFKVDWPAAPKPKAAEHRDQFNANFTFAQQGEVLDRSIELARTFGTKLVRCFDFWRIENQAPHRQAMNEILQRGAEKAGQNGVTLVLENEFACNTATATEAASVLSSVTSRFFMLNWDPGNAAMAGETPFPDGYLLLPKERIAHCHCKDVVRENTKLQWAPVGQGSIDWVGQFRALIRDGYRGVMSLETHWRGAGTAEASTIQSWNGMMSALQQAQES
jgi:sugar phosphate isomerase/epimerase